MANHQPRPRFCSVCRRAHYHPYTGLRKTVFWGQYFCGSHSLSNLDKLCRSCGRIEEHTKYKAIVDGKKICPDCLPTATMDIKECRRILKSTLNFFEKIDLKLEMEDAHVFLVDKDEMLRKMSRASCLSTCFGDFLLDSIPCEGLFLPTKRVNSVTKCSRVGNKFEVSKKAMRVPGAGEWFCVPRDGNGKAILIHYGMARIKTQTIMAHELMHLRIWKQGLASHLSSKIEEGLCHLISQMWLEQYVAESPFMQKLKEWLMIGNERRDGFREAKQAVSKNGLKATLNYLSKWHNFPPST